MKTVESTEGRERENKNRTTPVVRCCNCALHMCRGCGVRFLSDAVAAVLARALASPARHCEEAGLKHTPTLVPTNSGPYVLYPLFCRYLNVVIRASCHFRLIRLPSSFLLESLEKRKKERKLGRKDGSERDRFRFNL